MAHLKWTSRLFLIISIMLVIVTAIFIIQPITKTASVDKGYCHITWIQWNTAPCLRAGTTSYTIPIISGTFWYPMSPKSVKFTALSYDQHHADRSLYEKIGLSPSPTAFLVDDLSDTPMINCSTATDTSIKQKLVDYLPLFKGILNTTSLTDNEPEYYPERFIDCFYQAASATVFLKWKAMNVWLSVLFFFSLFGLFFPAVAMLAKNEPDGPLRGMAELLSFVPYLMHLAFYLLFVEFIAWGILNIEPLMECEKLFKKGSVFFLIKWLWKKSPCSAQSNENSSD
ncbi:hypothetical protein ACHWQZ_G011937 [Mnemiopsis leidyi]